MAEDGKTPETQTESGVQPAEAPRRDLPPAALRALKEAEERRAAQQAEAERAEEHGGPKGAEPTRYGDWERNGRAVDF